MCAHIAAIPRLLYISHEKFWDEETFCFRSQFGTDGAISFNPQNGALVGTFRRNDSPRICEYLGENVHSLFADADESVYKYAQEQALQYMLISFEQKVKRRSLFAKKTKEVALPVVTTVFWSEGNDVFSSDEENSFLENGGEYVDIICVSKTSLGEYLNESYELTSEEIDFAETLFDRRKHGGTAISKDLLLNIADEKSVGYDALLSALSGFNVSIK